MEELLVLYFFDPWTCTQGDSGGSSVLWEVTVMLVVRKESSYVPVINSEWVPR